MKVEERHRRFRAYALLLILMTCVLVQVLSVPVPVPKAEYTLQEMLDPIEADKEDALIPEIRSNKRLAFQDETPSELFQFGMEGEQERVKRIRK